ncbi:MAG: CapA family protein [Holophagales bacterium]|nr:CapA family protein [Holophagales bacterium]
MAALREEPGDVIVTAVGDMIFNERDQRPEGTGEKNCRILQESDVAIGNLEFSLNERPELQKPFYNFRAPRDFSWEVAATGINLVSMANNHALDFGAEGLKECLRALDLSGIAHAGVGRTLAEAHQPGRSGSRARRNGWPASPDALLTDRDLRADLAGPCPATINPARFSPPAKGEGRAVEGPPPPT